MTGQQDNERDTALTPLARQRPATAEMALKKRGLRLNTLDEAFAFAEMIVAAGLAPSSFKTPHAIVVAIEMGLEYGIPAMNSLQTICVINGRPALWGDGFLGVIMASGLLEDIEETVEGEGDNIVATCRMKRVGTDTPVVRTFSAQDAKDAGLWEGMNIKEEWKRNNSPWVKHKKRMCQHRARGFCGHDAFPDVLMNLVSSHEAADMPAGDWSIVAQPAQLPEGRTEFTASGKTSPPASDSEPSEAEVEAAGEEYFADGKGAPTPSVAPSPEPLPDEAAPPQKGFLFMAEATVMHKALSELNAEWKVASIDTVIEKIIEKAGEHEEPVTVDFIDRMTAAINAEVEKRKPPAEPPPQDEVIEETPQTRFDQIEAIIMDKCEVNSISEPTDDEMVMAIKMFAKHKDVHYDNMMETGDQFAMFKQWCRGARWRTWLEKAKVALLPKEETPKEEAPKASESSDSLDSLDFM